MVEVADDAQASARPGCGSERKELEEHVVPHLGPPLPINQLSYPIHDAEYLAISSAILNIHYRTLPHVYRLIPAVSLGSHMHRRPVEKVREG